MDFKEHVESRQTVYQGELVQVEKQQVVLPDQTAATREIVHHQPAIAVLMITADHQMILEQQWRAATNGLTLEIPAGKVEAGESMRAAAVRELNEETRLVADSLTQLAQFYTSPGFTDEFMTLYVATGLTPVNQALPQDADELINIVKMDLATAVAEVQAGQIQDAKTVMAIWYWQSHPTLGA
ncbi:NUDIX hydrolase [Lactiplantibacillus fabifermentans]|uniref:Nudix family hydrolase n=2 Tax=Lactiplantibacillus fabifermentans TaxID=483011 RepID=A0A0R2NQF8_9LACO|nr:NUDIX hydrolase [Lactiplantibacillus fabifermentans]ETY73922.1 ADP-ribose pyrophosphatase [Lactiplantibacillus fabifermentans T30PCM01]KRO26640.1 nudix family hydrolase [Lactiplantibacillus fabifermentans DSM 21115]